ncbi:hypothetical protein BGC07_05305 [Piscirickettsia litoralis]|uniref:Uncharacterized protein n=1 Tax=Piscirickettsia litoralis TaxID=1891921 RepID=A0ABX3A4X1_9GAMM|nr:hypothetical protein BGC07_05305 [Piscirickettsia litoralis]
MQQRKLKKTDKIASNLSEKMSGIQDISQELRKEIELKVNPKSSQRSLTYSSHNTTGTLMLESSHNRSKLTNEVPLIEVEQV